MANARHRTGKSNRKRQQSIERQLMARRGELLEVLRAEAARRENSPPRDPTDVGDDASEALDQDISFRIAELRSHEVNRIEQALEKLDCGGYGHCEECGAKIPKARLKVVPTATLCLTCQAAEERMTELEETDRWQSLGTPAGASDDRYAAVVRGSTGGRL